MVPFLRQCRMREKRKALRAKLPHVTTRIFTSSSSVVILPCFDQLPFTVPPFFVVCSNTWNQTRPGHIFRSFTVEYRILYQRVYLHYSYAARSSHPSPCWSTWRVRAGDCTRHQLRHPDDRADAQNQHKMKMFPVSFRKCWRKLQWTMPPHL